jgi:ammonia channel protein AmtB
MNVEVWYFWTMVVMWLIHAGFMTYETGVSRRKNVMHTVMKNVLLISVVTASFYFPGWWIYAAFVDGFVPRGPDDAFTASTYPWGPNMGPNLQDHLTGVFWAAFLLFSWTAASIVSGAAIERIRLGAFLILAAVVGSVVWILDASWGWSAEGWMTKAFGYHDTIAGGVVHGVAGAFALGVVINLGRRVGKFQPDGTPRVIPPHNQWMTLLGLMLIFVGFWGFYGACLVFGAGQQPDAFAWQTIYLDPTTLSSLAFNFIMSWAGGAIAAYVVSRRDPFWTLSGALAGLIANSAGATEYYPPLAFTVGGIGAVAAYAVGQVLSASTRSTTRSALSRSTAWPASRACCWPASSWAATRPAPWILRSPSWANSSG